MMTRTLRLMNVPVFSYTNGALTIEDNDCISFDEAHRMHRETVSISLKDILHDVCSHFYFLGETQAPNAVPAVTVPAVN